jgi:hypothetical protein
MTVHLLDTDTLTLFQKGHGAVCNRCAAAPGGSLAITVISVEEQSSAGTRGSDKQSPTTSWPTPIWG